MFHDLFSASKSSSIGYNIIYGSSMLKNSDMQLLKRLRGVPMERS